MAVKLDDLMKMLSAGILQGQTALSKNSVDIFFTDFSGEDELFPHSRTIHIPRKADLEDKVIVPIPALRHHHTLQLREVTVKLKAKLDSGPDGLTVELAPLKEDPNGGPISELDLTFKLEAPPEGLAKTIDRMVEHI